MIFKFRFSCFSLQVVGLDICRLYVVNPQSSNQSEREAAAQHSVWSSELIILLILSAGIRLL